MTSTKHDVSAPIIEHLDSIGNPKQKIEVIEGLLYFLNFERRLAGLSPEEREHMKCEFSEDDRQRVDQCEFDKERDELTTKIARVLYFRKLHWDNYLNGHTSVKPSILADDIHI
jgi:hypothetical protein